MAAYGGTRARNYDRRWRTFTERTHAAVLEVVEGAYAHAEVPYDTGIR